MSWLGAIASLAGTVASGVGSALANRSEKEQIERERGAMNHWYNQQIYQDPTKRPDYAAVMNQLKLSLRKKNEVEDNKRTILGGTNESALAMQQQNANAMANVAEQQMADQAKRVDMLNAQQRMEQTEYDRQQAALRARQAETWGNVAGNAAQSFGGFDASGKGGAGETGLRQAGETAAAEGVMSAGSGVNTPTAPNLTAPEETPETPEQIRMRSKNAPNLKGAKVSAETTGLETEESIRRNKGREMIKAGLGVIGRNI